MPGHSANQNDADPDCKQLFSRLSAILSVSLFLFSEERITYCRRNDQLVIPSERLLLSFACPNAKNDSRDVEKTKNHGGGDYEARFLIIGLSWSHGVLVDGKNVESQRYDWYLDSSQQSEISCVVCFSEKTFIALPAAWNDGSNRQDSKKETRDKGT